MIVSVAGGDKDSRSFEELEKISAVLLAGRFAHVDSILNGSGSSRNRPETILPVFLMLSGQSWKEKVSCLYLRMIRILSEQSKNDG